jgi:mRNA-degrading endonuclease RelE of RelBE toxin-antitoxin system
MMKISASEQVQTWLTGLPPETKHRVRLALRGLARGRGDIKGLLGPLSGFNRLRIGGLRIIFRQTRSQEIRLEYANNRDVIYELYQEILASKVSR